MEELEWDEFKDQTNDKLNGSNGQADHVLSGVKWVGFDGSTSVLNHSHLDDESEDCNVDEKHVSEDSLKDVLFSLFKLSGIDLVENLHEHKCLEHICKMKALLGSVTSL